MKNLGGVEYYQGKVYWFVAPLLISWVVVCRLKVKRAVMQERDVVSALPRNFIPPTHIRCPESEGRRVCIPIKSLGQVEDIR
jgi:hypothetical protein